MSSKNIVLLGVGGTLGFIAGNLFLAGKIIESEKMRNALSDIICEKVDKIIFGDQREPNSNRVSYRSYYENRNGNSHASYKDRERRVKNEVLFETAKAAEEIIVKMNEIINDYGFVTIADYYELCDINESTFLDDQYGWTNTDNMKVVRCKNGYFVKMSAAVRKS